MVGTPAATGTRSGPGSATGSGTGFGRVPALDGVRGIAVIAVLLFHGGVSWARGGFLGVDAFFVLSGLLITSLLLEEARASGRIGLGHFWSRRARRLLPALLALVAASAVYGAVLATPDALDGLRKDALATLAYVANWRYIAAGASYFESTAQPSVLRHTWSLAIEEQFYVAWPIVMVLLARNPRRIRWTAAFAAVGIAGSAIAMWVLHDPGSTTARAYYGTDTRAQVVLMGALLAALVAAQRREGLVLPTPVARGLGVAAAAGLVMFVGAVGLVDGSERSLYQGGFLAVAIGVAFLLAHIVLVPAGWSARALSWAPLRAVGLVSYGLYVWHWPIYLTITHERTKLAGLALLAVRLAVTAVVATVSYFALEMPIRRGALPRMQAATILPVAVAVAVVAVLLATVPPPTKPVAAAAAAPDPRARPVPRRPGRPAGAPARVLLVGDSVAKTLGMRYVKVDHRYGLDITNAGILGCGVVRGGPYRYFGQETAALKQCETWPAQWERHVRRADPDVALVIVGRWEVMDRVHQKRWMHLGQPAFDAYIETEVERAVEVLSGGGATVAFATAPYFKRGERPDGGRWPEDDPRRVDAFNRIVRRVVARHADRAVVIELNERTSRNRRYTPIVDGVSLRFDGVHFSPEGARWLEPWLLTELEALAPPASGPPVRPTTTTYRPGASTTRPPRATATTQRVASSTSTTRATTTSSTTTSTTRPPTTLIPDG